MLIEPSVVVYSSDLMTFLNHSIINAVKGGYWLIDYFEMIFFRKRVHFHIHFQNSITNMQSGSTHNFRFGCLFVRAMPLATYYSYACELMYPVCAFCVFLFTRWFLPCTHHLHNMHRIACRATYSSIRHQLANCFKLLVVMFKIH